MNTSSRFVVILVASLALVKTTSTPSGEQVESFSKFGFTIGTNWDKLGKIGIYMVDSRFDWHLE